MQLEGSLSEHKKHFQDSVSCKNEEALGEKLNMWSCEREFCEEMSFVRIEDLGEKEL
jgi:hypothetical protein